MTKSLEAKMQELAEKLYVQYKSDKADDPAHTFGLKDTYYKGFTAACELMEERVKELEGALKEIKECGYCPMCLTKAETVLTNE
jgi:hypothetical protein